MRTDHLGGPITGGVTLTLGKYCPDKEKALPVERDSLPTFKYENEALDHTKLTILFTHMSNTCVLRGRRFTVGAGSCELHISS